MTDTTTKSFILHSNGPIDPASWELFGVSAKPGENAIGRFGTGFSIGIAGLLRLGHSIEIHSEDNHWVFGLETMDFRGKEFQRVTCNGEKLGFTTHMGSHWEADAFYRELVSNCMDESGLWFVGDGPLDGGTSIVVTGPTILESHANHNDIFIGDREPIAETKALKFYEGNGTIYFRGVRVGLVENAMFSYEIMDDLELSEDRGIKYQYQVPQRVGREITHNLKDKELIRRILTCSEARWEYKVDFDWSEWSTEFQEVAEDLWRTCPTRLNRNVFKMVRQKIKDIGWEARELGEDKEIMLEKAKDFLKRGGYEVTAPVKLVDNEDAKVIAFYFNDVIHLTEKSFDEGMFQLVRTLMEEHFHSLGFDDACRSFEDFLMKEVIKQSSKRLREPL